MKKVKPDAIVFAVIFIIGLAMIGYSSNGMTGLLSSVGFGLVGLAIGYWYA